VFNRRIAYVILFIKIGDLYSAFNKKFGFETNNLHKIKSKKLFNYYERNVIKYIKFFQAINLTFDLSLRKFKKKHTKVTYIIQFFKNKLRKQ